MTIEYGTPPADESKLTHEVRRMPRWKVGLFAVSLVVGVAGLVATGVGAATRKPPQTVTVSKQVTVPGSGGGAPAGSSGFMGGGGGSTAPQTTTVTETKTVPSDPSLLEAAGPYLGKYGFSFFVGLVLGFLTRTFMKIAAGVAVLVAAAAFALHYFHVVDVDMTAVQKQTANATSWIQAEAGQLKDLVMAHLPSAGAGAAGFLFGMKRR